MTGAGFDRHTLRSQRLKRGLTQQALADLLGVTKSAVSEWERGSNAPLTVVLLPLADALGCSIDALFTRGDTPAGARI